jgi:hypothetical protein
VVWTTYDHASLLKPVKLDPRCTTLTYDLSVPFTGVSDRSSISYPMGKLIDPEPLPSRDTYVYERGHCPRCGRACYAVYRKDNQAGKAKDGSSCYLSRRER